MSFDICTTPIGLSKLQLAVYQTTIDLEAAFFFGPSMEQLRQAIRPRYRKLQSAYLDRAISQLIRRGYLKQRADGTLWHKPPPHGLVIREVCCELQITVSQLRGEDKSPRLVRGRHMVTKRLRKEFHYSYFAIADALMRSHTVVSEYARPERRAQRSRDRVVRAKHAKLATVEVRAGA